MSHTLFEAEARDYFTRLIRYYPLDGSERVLDFGCGLGFVSAQIASQAGQLWFWDYSESMLAAASERLAGIKVGCAAGICAGAINKRQRTP